MPKRFSSEDARRIGATLGIDWSEVDLEQFRQGLEVELALAAKIVLAHLDAIPDYYTRLAAMTAEAAGVHRGQTEHRLSGEPD